MLYLLALLIGVVAGLRAMTAPAAVAWGEPSRRPDLQFGLLLLSVVGALAMAGAADGLILVMGAMITALSVMGLIALGGGRARAEATMKLFLYQGVAGAVLLFGLTWLFGLGGSTSFAALGGALQAPDALLTYGMLIVLGGLAFTVAAIPFHAWLPDVTEGSSASTGVWLLGGAALAAVAALVRLLMMVFATNNSLWAPYVTGLAVLSLVGGGLLALAQSDVRRMLGFSAVAGSGFVLLALVSASHAASSHEGLAALVMTLLTGGVGLVGLLAGLCAVKATTLEDLSGLHRRSPGLAAAMTACALAIAALPLAGAFWARLTLLRGLLLYVSQSLQFGMIALAVLAMAVSVLMAYTALRIPKAIYLSSSVDAPPTEVAAPAGPVAVLMLCALLSVAFFVAPAPFWALVSFATTGF